MLGGAGFGGTPGPAALGTAGGKRANAAGRAERVDWAAFMQAAGAIGWTPAVFWRATPSEFSAFLAGWQRANGVETHAGPAVSREEFEELKACFPD